MPDAFLDPAVLDSFASEEFDARRPFPWVTFQDLVLPEAFERLHTDFPPLSMFEWHEDRERTYGQRPHNRYYLAYRSPQYVGYEGAPKEAFPEAWQEFLTELETNRAYLRLMERAACRADLKFRYTFHVAVEGSEVSPHRDKGRKAATHIFYFNTADDWDPSWGGATLLLDGKQAEGDAPGFDDFRSSTPVEHLGNASFLFRNTAGAWHGVPPLTCPQGAQRRIFNVVAEIPEAPAAPATTAAPSRARRTAAKLRQAVRGS